VEFDFQAVGDPLRLLASAPGRPTLGPLEPVASFARVLDQIGQIAGHVFSPFQGLPVHESLMDVCAHLPNPITHVPQVITSGISQSTGSIIPALANRFLVSRQASCTSGRKDRHAGKTYKEP